jgi:hypothetical protein
MRRLLLSILCLGLIVGPAATGAMARFTDTAQSANNVFQAWSPIQWLLTTQADFNSGVLNQVDTSASQGDVKLATTSDWYSSSWQYRRETMLSSATSMANYQIRVTLTTAIMGNPYSNVKADGSDIRFAGDDGVTLQDYWIESWNNTGTSTIWVEVANSGTSKIYMYYGNTSAIAASNGDNTFDFFDDFLGTSLDTTNKWDVINSSAGSYSVNGGLLTIQSTGDWFGTADTSLYVVSKSSFSFNYAAESLINQIGSDSYPRFFGLRASSATNSKMFVMVGDSDRSHITNAYRDSDGGNAAWYGENTGIANPGNNKVARFERDGNTVRSYYNNSLMNTRTVTNWNLVKVALTDTFVAGTQQASKFDWIFVRKYGSPEPITSVGAEENQSAGTTGITFQVRASDTPFAKDAAIPGWTDLGIANSPITSGLPSGQYKQWRATLVTSDTSKTPTLHDVTVEYY